MNCSIQKKKYPLIWSSLSLEERSPEMENKRLPFGWINRVPNPTSNDYYTVLISKHQFLKVRQGFLVFLFLQTGKVVVSNDLPTVDFAAVTREISMILKK